MRSRTIYDKHGNVKYEEVDGVVKVGEQEYRARLHEIMPEIAPYQSMKTGEWITSRSKHHDHMERYDVHVVENGEGKTSRVAKDTSIKDMYVANLIHGMTHEQRKAAIKRDVDFITWNSNGLPRS